MGARPPGPAGSAASFLQITRVGLLPFLAQLASRYGDVARFELAGTSYYLLNRRAHVRTLFVEQVERLTKPEFLRRSNRGHWGDGLTSLEMPSWKPRSDLVHTALRAHDPARHREIVTACTQDMLDSWRQGQTVALREQLRILTARIAVRMLFDAELEGHGEPRGEVVRFEEAFGEDFTVNILGADTATEGIVPFAITRPRAPRDMSSTVALIEARMRGCSERGDVLSLLLSAVPACEPKLAPELLIDELVQMLFAGHHTLPETLVHVCHVLARGPELAGRARGDPRYLELVIRETMRMFPPAPILYREVALPLRIDGYELEPGAAVWVCPWLLHHDPRNFPDPDRFEPERFARDGEHDLKRFAYLPFGAGPRTCVASRLSLAQISSICAQILQRYTLVPEQRAPSTERFVVGAPGRT